MKYVHQRPVVVVSTKMAQIFSENWSEVNDLLLVYGTQYGLRNISAKFTDRRDKIVVLNPTKLSA